MVKRIADKYANICGYRQHGLKYDDLLIEENDTVQKVGIILMTIYICRDSILNCAMFKALHRLTPREEYDRAYRIRLASQLSVLHHGLPKEQVMSAEQVRRRLSNSY